MGEVVAIREPREQVDRIEEELLALLLEVTDRVYEITTEWNARRVPLESRLKVLQKRYLDHLDRSRVTHTDAS